MYLLSTYYVPDIVLGNGKHVLCHPAKILTAVGTLQQHHSLSDGLCSYTKYNSATVNWSPTFLLILNDLPITPPTHMISSVLMILSPLLDFYWCATNDHKLRDLKRHPFITSHFCGSR